LGAGKRCASASGCDAPEELEEGTSSFQEEFAWDAFHPETNVYEAQ